MKMRNIAVLITLVICVSCVAFSPTDKAIEQISYCVAEDRLDSLSTLIPSLRLSESTGNEVIACAGHNNTNILGAALVVAKPPREAASIFVNMLASSEYSVCANASDIVRQAISCYKALNMIEECDTFVMAVDESTLRLPINIQAKVLTGCTTPEKLGAFLKRNGDSVIIDAVNRIYSSDSVRQKQFNDQLN